MFSTAEPIMKKRKAIDALKAGKVDDVVEAARTSGEAFT